jgi:RHS repeat-associated protein
MIQLCEDTATINENNGVTYTDRDSLGMMAAIVRPDGKKSTFQYIAANWPEVLSSWDTSTKPWGVVSSSNPDGPLITYDRDKNGKVKTAVIQASSGEKRYWTFKYDNFGSKTEERLQAGEVLDDSLDYIQRWSYTDFGAPKSYKVGINGPIWQYQYNSRANVTSIIAPDGGEVKYLYTQSGKLKNITNQIGHTVDYKYTKRGLLSSLVERYEVGKESTTKYLYNHRGFIRKILDPFGEAWSYEYDEADELSTLIDPLGKKVTYQYDAKGRETLLIDGNGATVAHEYFDTAPPGAAPQTEIAFPLQVLVKYPTYVEQQQFDIMGRLIKKTLVSNDKSVTEDINYEYDALGNLVVVIRPDGERVEYTWDFLNRIKSIKAPNEGVTSIAYSQGDRKVIYTDSQGGKITYEFDEAQRLIKKIGADGIITSYTYNINGNKETVTRGNGQIFKFAYDEAQRLKSTEIFSSIGAPTPLRSINYSRNLRGDITAVIDGSLLQHYILDPIGRVLTSATTYDTGFTKTNSYTYTASGLLKSETTVDGTVLSYLWDSANQFQGINIPSKGSIIVGYTLQNFDQPSSITFPGGSKKIFEYDSLRRLKKISSVDQVGNVLLDYGYTLQAGPLTGAVIKNLSTEHGAYIYSYDKAFRLTGVQYPNATEENFTYDELGRRQPVTGGPWSYTATGAVTDTGSVQYTYDGNGNRKTKTEAGITTHYFYDENDNLARIETPLGTVIAKYTYDNLSRRMSKQIGGTKTYFYYNETGLAAELDSNGTVTRQYLFAPDGEWTSSLLAIEENDLYYFSHNDHLGTPQKLVTSDGNISWSARYKAFGETDVLTSAIQNYLRFPGQYADLETGLYSNFHRHYDPVLGTYIEQDSYGPLDNFTTLVKSVFQLSRIKGRPTFDRWKGISEGTSKVDQDPNLYTYTSGNPVNFYDPFGLYGTNSCEYYVQRCLESGGKYYCKTVKYACNTFPKYPDPNPDEDNDFEGWPRCTRQCLQDCDREQNATQNFCPPEPDPNTDSFFDLGATGCHFKCYIECGTEWFSNAIVPEAY